VTAARQNLPVKTVTEGNRGNEEMEIRGFLRALRFLPVKYFDEF
jgi:hypothetical protein